MKIKASWCIFPLDLFLICHCVVPSLYFPYPYLCSSSLCVVCHVTQRALIGPNILTCVSDQFQCKVCSQEERKSVSVPSVEPFNFISSASFRNAHNWSSSQIDILSMIMWFSFPYIDFVSLSDRARSWSSLVNWKHKVQPAITAEIGGQLNHCHMSLLWTTRCKKPLKSCIT